MSDVYAPKDYGFIATWPRKAGEAVRQMRSCVLHEFEEPRGRGGEFFFNLTDEGFGMGFPS